MHYNFKSSQYTATFCIQSANGIDSRMESPIVGIIEFLGVVARSSPSGRRVISAGAASVGRKKAC